MIHSFLHSPLTRLGVFIAMMVLLWCIEFGVPFATRRQRNYGINLLLTFCSLVIYSVCAAFLAIVLERTAQIPFGLFHWMDISMTLQVIIGVLFLDFFGAWLVHFLLHKFSMGWRFHCVHHLDKDIDVTTALRHHPVESVIRFAFMFIAAVFLGVPMWVVTFYQFIASTNALIEHANIRLPIFLERLLNPVLVTPGFHHIHHSVEQPETDSNYGNIFSLWDHIFGTAHTKRINQVIPYGLNDHAINENSLKELVMKPFGKIK
jgi:sterol desaturase/sphingolipid hydroxylase (fatty acid hydroxylase superfamily)